MGIGGRMHEKADYEALTSYDNLMELVETDKTSLNYNYESGLDRMQSDKLVKDKAVMVTWGQMKGAKGYAMFLIKDLTIENGVSTVTFDAKFYEYDFRTEYNSLAIENL
jgi:hypothetical protein